MADVSNLKINERSNVERLRLCELLKWTIKIARIDLYQRAKLRLVRNIE